MPAAANPAHIYGFRPMIADQFSGFMRAGRLEVIDKRNRRGVVQAPGGAGIGAAPAVANPQNVWILAEMIEGHKIGERIVPPVGFPTDGSWGLMSLTNSSGVIYPYLIYQLDESEVPTFCDDPIEGPRSKN